MKMHPADVQLTVEPPRLVHALAVIWDLAIDGLTSETEEVLRPIIAICERELEACA